MNIGKAEIDTKARLVAGSFQTVRYTFTAGHAIDDTGCVKVVFRYVGDFGTPQFESQKAPNYCTVSTTGDCRIEPHWDPKGHTRPWGKALYLRVMGGFLDKGESITVTFGDTDQGSPGWQVQSFCEETFEFKTWVDPFATCRFKELRKSPVLEIIAGSPVKAVCIAPSQVQCGRPLRCFLRLEDRWGNAVGKAQALTLPAFPECGVHTVKGADEVTGLEAESNPIEVLETFPPRSRWWADFHGQTEETIGTNSIDDYFRYARDCARLDIVGHQGNDFQVTDAFWETVNHTTAKYNRTGRFVTFPGYEWSGNTPLGGDRNVYHGTEGGPIYRSCHDLLPGEESIFPAAPTAKELFKKLNATESFAFAHVGGRYADVAMHKEGVEIAMEIHSAWGTFEWLVDDALRRGYRIGICANSDGHKCRPGASYPGAGRFGSYGGLTCMLAAVLDRDHILDALRRRHFYATTGHRPLLDVTVETNGESAMMGDVIRAGERPPVLSVKAIGTAPIDYIEVRNGLDVIKTYRPDSAAEAGARIKVVWSGARVKGRDRIVSWDGALRVRGNRIIGLTPVNFWNPDKQPCQTGTSTVTWESITIGGLTGLILDLEKPHAGRIEIQTRQRQCACDMSAIARKPRVYRAGGLRKQIELYRLPDPACANREATFTLRLRRLRAGDNPIYVKVVQQDGHMAWSSPVYVKG